jgi:hypothetical protein
MRVMLCVTMSRCALAHPSTGSSLAQLSDLVVVAASQGGFLHADGRGPVVACMLTRFQQSFRGCWAPLGPGCLACCGYSEIKFSGAGL